MVRGSYFLDLKYEGCFADKITTEDLVDRTAQKQQQTWESENTVRHSLHWGCKSTRWTWRCADLWNDLGFSLCAVLSVYYMVAISNRRKESEMEVSIDWCVTVEHRGLSSIKVIFVDYQASELQCNY